MQRNEAIQLIQQTFEASYDEGRFRRFIKEIFHTLEERDDSYAGTLIPAAYRDAVKSYKYLFKYTTPDQFKTEIAVFAVNVANKHKLEKARSELRNFMAYVMKQRNKEVVLVAFYTDEDNKADWRFSFVRRESSYDFEAKKAETIISPAKRYSYLVGEKETSHTAKEQFVDLVVKERNNPTLAVLENAFAVEKVSNEFYEKYKELYLGLCDAMIAILKRDEKINANFEFNQISVELFCKKLMGQIVFLYFIQKKGWLGVEKDQPWGSGDRRFLRTIFEDAKTKGLSYFNDCLEPLFYDALATERDSHWYPRLKCKIPFLNGGLFDPVNNYDWVHTNINIPNKLFSNDDRSGILDVFDIYNFTVKEDEPLEKEVAIDPEMLGKVFENLLEIREKKSKGTFYTPREIVHYMCQESLTRYLYTKLNKVVTLKDLSFFVRYGDTFSEFESKVDEIKKYTAILPESIKQHAKAIDDALADIKICDPAVGSGAFPVGLMHEIIRARQTLLNAGFVREAKRRSTYEYKRQVIQNSIYGVDIDESAIEVAKLRLWLSLIVDEDDINNIKPLPNLDYKIVRGNSLQQIEANLFNIKALQEVEILKGRFFDVTSKSEKKNLNKQINGIFNLLTDGGNIFDFKIYFSEIFKTEKSERNYEMSSTMFDGQQMELPAHIPEYGKGGGFDIVIGNPPYVSYGLRSVGKLTSDDKRGLEKLFPNSAEYKISMYAMFMELAIRLGNSTGVSSYIVPDSFLLGRYFSKIRKYALDKCHIDYIALIKKQVFANATVGQSVVYQFSHATDKSEPTNIILAQDQFELAKKTYMLNQYSQTYFDELEYNRFRMLFDKTIYDLIRKIDDKSDATVGDFIKFRSGLIGIDGQDSIKSTFCKTPDWKPGIFSGSAVHRYIVTPTNEFLCCDPAVIKSGGIRTVSYFEPKLFVRQTGDRLTCAYDDNNLLAINNVHIGNSVSKECDMKYVAAVINSQLLDFYYKTLSLEEGRAMAQVDIEMIERLPVPKATSEQQQPIIDLVDKIIATKKADKTADTSAMESKIDALVYKLYDLTPEEIATVEGK